MGAVRRANVALIISTAATATAVVGGTHLPAGCYFVLLVVGYLGFGAYLVAVHRLPSARAGGVLIASGILLVAAMVQPPLESGDVWSYSAYGRLAAHYHQSPWTHTPASHPKDPYTLRVVHIWRHTPSVYGPAFIPPAAAVMAVAGTNQSVARLGFQFLAALAVAAAIAMLGRETKWNPGAIAVIGLNPLIIISVVNGAHNDAWCGALLLGAVVFARRERWVLAGALVGLAASIKVTAMLAVIGLAVWAWRRVGVAAAAKVSAAALALTGTLVAICGGRDVVRAMTWNSWRVTGSTIWGAARNSLLPAHATRVDYGHLTTMAMLTVVLIAAGLVVGHRRASHPSLLVGLAFMAYVLAGAYVWPWYAVWGIVPLALCWYAPTTRMLLAVGMLLELATVPSVHGMTHHSETWQLPLTVAHWINVSLPWTLAALVSVVIVSAAVRWRGAWMLAPKPAPVPIERAPT
ncbi:MAG: hypothetical protein JWM05_1257 [Acidimicrobiales bacterium]|nr:hypothetical protein [Acidimicrobiales bacterium]